MKSRFTFVTTLAPILVALALLALPKMASAIPLTIGDSNELGFVEFGIPSGDADRTAYVNHLIGMACGTTDNDLDQTFTRSLNFALASLPVAVFALNGGGTTINLGTTNYTYLFAKYDGPNYGSEVWYIDGLTGTITIPATGGGFGLSGWTLFTGSPTQTVPDGGTTLMLLGASLATVELLRRKLLKG